MTEHEKEMAQGLYEIFGIISGWDAPRPVQEYFLLKSLNKYSVEIKDGWASFWDRKAAEHFEAMNSDDRRLAVTILTDFYEED